MEIQTHRNSVQSIEVKILSVKDEDGNEINDWFGKKPGSIVNMVRGEAERLIKAKRAIATSDIKPKPKRGRPPANKMATAETDK